MGRSNLDCEIKIRIKKPPKLSSCNIFKISAHHHFVFETSSNVHCPFISSSYITKFRGKKMRLKTCRTFLHHKKANRHHSFKFQDLYLMKSSSFKRFKKVF